MTLTKPTNLSRLQARFSENKGWVCLRCQMFIHNWQVWKEQGESRIGLEKSDYSPGMAEAKAARLARAVTELNKKGCIFISLLCLVAGWDCPRKGKTLGKEALCSQSSSQRSCQLKVLWWPAFPHLGKNSSLKVDQSVPVCACHTPIIKGPCSCI